MNCGYQNSLEAYLGSSNNCWWWKWSWWIWFKDNYKEDSKNMEIWEDEMNMLALNGNQLNGNQRPKLANTLLNQWKFDVQPTCSSKT